MIYAQSISDTKNSRETQWRPILGQKDVDALSLPTSMKKPSQWPSN